MMSFRREDGRIKHRMYVGLDDSDPKICQRCNRTEDYSCPSGHGETGIRYDGEDSCMFFKTFKKF